ncbi:myb-like protein X isoform X2 [Zophobas morio]|uniref:myb-like protein X isoform X2 n=1 Tax=Zophobas morio TaxID=2755281 RepID=UPI003082CF7D
MPKIQKNWSHRRKKKKIEETLTKDVKRTRRRSRISFTARRYRKTIRSRNISKILTPKKESLDNPLEGGDFSTKQQCEVEPRDSTIHVVEPDDDDDDYEPDDEDEDKSHSSQARSPHTIVMAQYNALHMPYGGGEYSESENEDFGAQSDDSVEDKKYIDSGLRPLKAGESRLFLHKIKHDAKKTTPKKYDGVQPLLKKISSSVFRKEKEPEKEELEEEQPSEVASKPSSVIEDTDEDRTEETEDEREETEDEVVEPEEEEVVEPEEEEVVEPEEEEVEPEEIPSTATLTSHPSGLIDTRPLLKFDEPEDVKDEPGDYSRTKITSQPSGLIDTRPLLKFGEPEDDKPVKPQPKHDFKPKFKLKRFRKKKDDICVHTKEVPEGQLKEYSSTTVDGVTVKEKKRRSIFRFFRKNDFCVHTAEPGKDTLSVDSSRLSLMNIAKETKIANYDVQQSVIEETHQVRHLAPIEESQKRTRKPVERPQSSSRSSSKSNLSQFRQTSLLLPSNRERRFSKNFKSKGDFSDSTSSRSSRSKNSGRYFSKRKKPKKQKTKAKND